MSTTIDMQLNSDGSRPAHCWPGGYPLFYLCRDGGVLCPKCANRPESLTADPSDRSWFVVGQDANYEDDNLSCDHCSATIQSAYGEPETDTPES